MLRCLAGLLRASLALYASDLPCRQNLANAPQVALRVPVARHPMRPHGEKRRHGMRERVEGKCAHTAASGHKAHEESLFHEWVLLCLFELESRQKHETVPMPHTGARSPGERGESHRSCAGAPSTSEVHTETCEHGWPWLARSTRAPNQRNGQHSIRSGPAARANLLPHNLGRAVAHACLLPDGRKNSHDGMREHVEHQSSQSGEPQS